MLVPTRRLFRAAAIAVAGACLGVLPVGFTGVASAAPQQVDSVLLNGFEAALVHDINAARVHAGRHPLRVVPGTTDVARRWAWHMASGMALTHNSSLEHDIQDAGSGAWTMLAENVGLGPADGPTMLFRAYMSSPPHRANILDPAARFLGVGVVERSSVAYNTLDFTNAYNSRYGPTRVPAAGLTMDAVHITDTTEVARFDGTTDQRFGVRSTGAVAASRLSFGPPRGAAAASTVLRSRRHGGGSGAVVMRQALDLTHASALLLRLGVGSRHGRAVAVRIVLRGSFGRSVVLGTVPVDARGRTVTLRLPAAARCFRNTLVLSVSAPSIRRAGGWARLGWPRCKPPSDRAKAGIFRRRRVTSVPLVRFTSRRGNSPRGRPWPPSTSSHAQPARSGRTVVRAATISTGALVMCLAAAAPALADSAPSPLPLVGSDAPVGVLTGQNQSGQNPGGQDPIGDLIKQVTTLVGVPDPLTSGSAKPKTPKPKRRIATTRAPRTGRPAPPPPASTGRSPRTGPRRRPCTPP